MEKEKELEARLLALAGDILTAVGRGELGAEAPVVRAAGVALVELRRRSGPAGAEGLPGVGPRGGATVAAGDASPTGTEARGPRVAPAIEQVLRVATRMRRDRQSFAAACLAEAEALGTSAQAVRNACTRWLGVPAGDWQPLLIGGADAAVLGLARRAAARCPWLRDRISTAFGVPGAGLEGAEAAG